MNLANAMIFPPLNSNIEPPLAMNNPFDYEPHPLCLLAADEVRRYLKHDATCECDARNGKMFGVLVVKTSKGETGFLAEDGVDAFAEKLRKLMSDKDLRCKMGTAAKQAMKPYRAENIWHTWEKLLQEVVDDSAEKER